MAGEVKANPGQIAALGLETLAAAVAIGDHRRDSVPELRVPPAAFGRLAGPDVAASQHDLCASTDSALAVFAAVYEGDTGHLYQAAASYQRTDDENAGRLGKLGDFAEDHLPFI